MSFDRRPASRVTFWGNTSVALCIFVSASIAALIAHTGIDVFGDELLPHDAYDDVAHGSRSIVSCALLVVIMASAIRFFLVALGARCARGHAPRMRDPSRSNCAGWLFLTLVIVTAFMLIGLMGIVDIAIAGGSLGDIDDIFGGSIPLAMGIALPVTLGVAAAMWRVAGWLSAARQAALRIVRTFFVCVARAALAALVCSPRFVPCIARAPALARNTAKRGPPATFA